MATHCRHFVAANWNCSLNSKNYQHLCELSLQNKASSPQPIKEVNSLKLTPSMDRGGRGRGQGRGRGRGRGRARQAPARGGFAIQDVFSLNVLQWMTYSVTWMRTCGLIVRPVSTMRNFPVFLFFSYLQGFISLCFIYSTFFEN